MSGAGTFGVGGRSVVLSQVMIFINGLLLLHVLWERLTPPGTAHDLVSAAARRIPGFSKFVQPAERPKAGMEAESDADSAAQDRQHHRNDSSDRGASSCGVDDTDLMFFRSRVEQEKVPQAGPWETMIQKEVPGVLKYLSQRRMLNDIKKTEYMTTSLTTDTSPREVMDFYWNDPLRQKWDSMLTKAEILENGDFSRREQIVHWVRSFPFSFLSDRDYVIGRREFQRGQVLYGITKVIKYPQHDPGKLVQTDNYWSMWSCEPVSCPYNTGKPATKTILLHMEDFKIPENLSRFAVKHGMWGFIKQMTPHMQEFIKARRARGISPSDKDPEAFGAPSSEATIARTVSPVQQRDLQRGGNSASVSPVPRRSVSEGNLSNSSTSSRSKMRRVASAVVAGGMLIALGAAERNSDCNLSRTASQRASKRSTDEEDEEQRA